MRASAVIVVAALMLGLVLPTAGEAVTTPEGPPRGGMTPLELHAAYQLPFETPSASEETPALSQQTVAVIEVGQAPTVEGDLGVYSRQFGLPECTSSDGCLKVINQYGKARPLPAYDERAGETGLDVQTVHAICITCHILVVEVQPEGDWLKPIGEGVKAAVAAGATEVSLSIEEDAADEEAEEKEKLEDLERRYFTHPGVVITAAAGDCGYDYEAGRYAENEIGEGCPGKISGGNYPGYPGKLGTVVSVGGTELAEVGGLWRSKAWFNGGSGCATVLPTPPWQGELSNWGEAGCAGRAVADVSADASCLTGPLIYTTHESPNPANPNWDVACGTSAASPIVAAEFALAGGDRGNQPPARTLYSHAGESDAFYDVTEGLNGICADLIACEAGPGYDEPTGLGSPVGLYAFSLPGAPRNESPPAISGSAEVGGTLMLVPGSWEGATTTSHEWQECDGAGLGCRPIMGATASTYTLTESDADKTFRVVETAGNAAGYGPPAVSTQTPVVTGAASGPGTVPGEKTSPAPQAPAGAAKGSALPSISPRNLRVTPRGYAWVTLGCPLAAPGGCVGRLTIRLDVASGNRDPKTVGRASYRLRAGQRHVFRICVAEFARRLLARGRSVHVIVAAAEAGTQQTVSVRAAMRLRRGARGTSSRA